jgi:putative endonuclease
MGLLRLLRGQRAESIARRHLEKAGCRLVRRNFRVPEGEVDLIMLDQDTIVFVEVRSRDAASPVDPAETVDVAKRRRIVRAARAFLAAERAARGRPARFDVVAVRLDEVGETAITWHRGAFDADGR